MDKRLILKDKACGGLLLRSIGSGDIEKLRKWKNRNRAAFFYQKIIRKEDQVSWFRKYLDDVKDFLFMAEIDGAAVGCIGFRLSGRTADVYNVMLGDAAYRRKGMMSSALKLLCSYIMNSHTKKIEVKVLISNATAVFFYLKNSFVVEKEAQGYCLMRLSTALFRAVPVEVRQE